MTEAEAIECGYLLEKEQLKTLPLELVPRLAVLKVMAKHDLPTDETETTKELRAKVFAEQICADILKALEAIGLEVAKAAIPMLISSLTSSIKKA